MTELVFFVVFFATYEFSLIVRGHLTKEIDIFTIGECENSIV